MTEVLAIDTNGFIARWKMTGPAGEEWVSVVVSAYDEAGRATHHERFGDDELEQARRRFVELVAAPRARRSPPNLATDALHRSLREATRGGVEAVSGLYGPGYRLQRHDHHIVLGLETYRAGEAWLVAETNADAEVVVTLGDRHCLYRFGYTWPGDRVSGESRVEHLVACRVDDEGRFVLEDVFDDGDLDEAVSCLIVRWADDEAAAAQPPIAAWAWSRYAHAFNRCDWDDLGDIFSADVRFADRRPASAGEIVGRHAMVDWTRTLREQVDFERYATIDVLALAPAAALFAYRITGSVAEGPFERCALGLAAFDGDSRIRLAVNWEPHQLDDAWALFDEVVADIAVGEGAC